MLRIRKSIKLLPGVRINFGKRGISTTIGKRGASINVSKRGTYLNAGIPGSGISTRTKLERVAPPDSTAEVPSAQRKPRPLRFLLLLLGGTFVIAMFRSPTLLYVFWGLMLGVGVIRVLRRNALPPSTSN